MRTWFAAHASGFGSAVSRLKAAPLGSALNALVIGIALSLPVGLYLTVTNLQHASHQLCYGGSQPFMGIGDDQLNT